MASEKGGFWGFMGTVVTLLVSVAGWQFGPWSDEQAGQGPVDETAMVGNAFAPGSGESTANLEYVTVETDAEEGGLTGVRIHVRLSTANLRGSASQLVAYFADAEGNSLEDDDGHYEVAGQVSASRDFVPDDDPAVYELFIPYEQLALESGTYDLQVHAEIFTSGSDESLAASAPRAFEVTIPD